MLGPMGAPAGWTRVLARKTKTQLGLRALGVVRRRSKGGGGAGAAPAQAMGKGGAGGGGGGAEGARCKSMGTWMVFYFLFFYTTGAATLKEA